MRARKARASRSRPARTAAGSPDARARREEPRSAERRPVSPGSSGSGAPGPSGFFVATAALGLPAGFYVWMLEGPRPLGAEVLRGTPRGVFGGLPGALAGALAGAALVVALLTAYRPARPWKARLAVAAGGFYAAALSSAVGAPALVLAPLAVTAHFVYLALGKRQPRTDAVLLALHAGGLGTAICFFHQWAHYQNGWAPFLENLAALRSLWFG